MNTKPQGKPQHDEKIGVVFQELDNGCIVPGQGQRAKPPMLELPPGVYTIHLSEKMGPHLHKVDQVKPPKKIYGDVLRNVARYFRTFEKNAGNTGVMLLGQKGSGKTATLRTMVDQAIQLSMPVIDLRDGVDLSLAAHILSQIQQDCMVVIDEIDKNYGDIKDDDSGNNQHKQQHALLGILDGSIGGGKKLFGIAGNDTNRISEYLCQRPSRVRYTQHFEKLPADVVLAYAKENVRNPSELERSRLFKMTRMANHIFNFDMLVAVVDEMNEYNEGALEAAGKMFGNLALKEELNYLVEYKNEHGQLVDAVGTEKYVYGGGFGMAVTLYVDPQGLEPERHIVLDDSHFLRFDEDGEMLYIKDGAEFKVYQMVEPHTHALAANPLPPARQAISQRMVVAYKNFAMLRSQARDQRKARAQELKKAQGEEEVVQTPSVGSRDPMSIYMPYLRGAVAMESGPQDPPSIEMTVREENGGVVFVGITDHSRGADTSGPLA